MSSSTLIRDLQTQPHKDIDAALSSLSRRKTDLPDFQLVLQAPDHPDKPITASTLKDIFIIVSAESLPEISDIIKDANQLRKLRVLFVHLDVPATCLPQMFARANLHMSKNVLAIASNDKETPRRVMKAWAWDSHHDLIATAEVSSHGKIIVTSCALKTYVVNFSDFAAFKNVSDKERMRFELDSVGSFIHWPGPDIHLNIESFRYICDPIFKEKADAEKLAHDQKFGKAIAKIRKLAGYTQANIPNVSERTVRDIESGSRPSVSTLKKLATAHSLSLNEYLNEIGKELTRS